MAGGVGEGLLGGTEQGKGYLGGQRARGSARVQDGRLAMDLHQRAQLVDKRWGILPQGGDGPPGLDQAVHAQVVGVLHMAKRPGGISPCGEDGPSSLQLDGEAGEGVGQHVVQLAGDACSLGQGCAADLFLSAQEPLAAV